MDHAGSRLSQVRSIDLDNLATDRVLTSCSSKPCSRSDSEGPMKIEIAKVLCDEFFIHRFNIQYSVTWPYNVVETEYCRRLDIRSLIFLYFFL